MSSDPQQSVCSTDCDDENENVFAAVPAGASPILRSVPVMMSMPKAKRAASIDIHSDLGVSPSEMHDYMSHLNHKNESNEVAGSTTVDSVVPSWSQPESHHSMMTQQLTDSQLSNMNNHSFGSGFGDDHKNNASEFSPFMRNSLQQQHSVFQMSDDPLGWRSPAVDELMQTLTPPPQAPTNTPYLPHDDDSLLSAHVPIHLSAPFGQWSTANQQSLFANNQDSLSFLQNQSLSAMQPRIHSHRPTSSMGFGLEEHNQIGRGGPFGSFNRAAGGVHADQGLHALIGQSISRPLSTPVFSNVRSTMQNSVGSRNATIGGSRLSQFSSDDFVTNLHNSNGNHNNNNTNSHSAMNHRMNMFSERGLPQLQVQSSTAPSATSNWVKPQQRGVLPAQNVFNYDNNRRNTHVHPGNHHRVAGMHPGNAKSPSLINQQSQQQQFSSPQPQLDEAAVHSSIITHCQQILSDAADHSLKAVELANTLRARVGTEMMAIVRERWGGLLSLLELQADTFLVERIPKNDRVSLKSSVMDLSLKANNGDMDARLAVANIRDGDNLSGLQSNNGFRSDAMDARGGESMEQQFHTLSLNGSEPEATVAVDANLTGFAGESINLNGASRCLHVGNVPPHYTEMNLANEFEKFGHLEGIKLIAQKQGQRRFAFVTFKTVAQAATARHCLSKTHPWKSAISFAHRDVSGGLTMSAFPSPSNNVNSNNNTNNNNSNNNGSSSSNNNNNNKVHRIGEMFPSAPSLSEQWPLVGRTPSPTSGSWTGLHGGGQPLPFHSPSPVMQNRSASASPTPSKTHSPAPPMLSVQSIALTQREQAVLIRLCDDTYVPTQPWASDAEADLPFCRAVIDQIAQFGGSTTISKLRGFLKHRVGTVDNIKSVPLKAMLNAYPNLFRVDGNFVSLVSMQSSF